MIESNWVDVIDYEGIYKVNKKGEIYSEYNKRKLKPYVSSDGYLRVNLSKECKVKIKMVHRLVAEALLENPKNLPVVNHIDGNKANPCLDNLEWVTVSENAKHAFDMGLSEISEKNRMISSKLSAENGAKTTSKEVIQFHLNESVIKVHRSIRDASRETKVNRANISMVCHGKRKQAGGYIWKFKE